MNALDPQRLHALDAVRGLALLLGVAFHAALSFMPGWPPGLWAMADSSTSPLLADAAFVAHSFRMTLFFLVAGFFARLLVEKNGSAGFVRNRSMRIALPLVIGWAVLYPLVSAVWLAGLRKVFGGELPPMPEMPKVPGAFPLLHLWFLYQLLQFYLVALVLRAALTRLDPHGWIAGMADAVVHAILRVPVAPLLLALPVAVVLASLPAWFYWTGVPTPDQSLVPQLPALVAYSLAFGIGWMLHRSRGAMDLLARYWFVHLLLGVLAVGAMLVGMRTSPPMAPPGWPAEPLALFAGTGLTKSGFALLHGTAAWGLSLGITGAALRFLSGYSPVRRYLADASYWIYLVHLPVVAALQVWVGHWPLGWQAKYPLVLAASLALLLASYHWLVRSTLLGQWLNGRRHRRTAADPAPLPPTPAPQPPRGPQGRRPVAELRAISQRFGTVTALDRVDLQLHAGELLAVLGPNGAGKSTAISLWLGLLEPDSGEAVLLGGSPRDVARRQGLGVMMQELELPKELSARDLVRLASSYYRDPLPLDETLRRAGVDGFADRAYGKLSGGQKRLVQFAIAICGQPQVLFLDEPSVGLDVQARQSLWSSIRGLLQGGCSVVLTTHYLEEAEALADRVAVLSGGRLVAEGSVDGMRALVGRRRISCQSSLAANVVGSWDGVVEAHVANGCLQLTASDAESVVRRLLAEDPGLSRLEVRQAGLNEAFNELTREAA